MARSQAQVTCVTSSRVADTRHFGRAAERSFVSQPTLSAQLKKLEEYLGVQLIERAPKRVALTAAGRGDRRAGAPHPRGERGNRGAGDGPPAIRSPAGSGWRCCRPSGPIYCRTWPRKLRKQLPRLRTDAVRVSDRRRCSRELHSGEIDVGILALPVTLDGLETYELYKEPFTVAMPAHHRLSAANQHQGERPAR